MAHVNIHQGRPAKKILGLSRNHPDGRRSVVFSDMPGTGDPGDAIAYDQDGSMLILHKFRDICSGGGRKPSYPAARWLKLQKRLQKKKTDRLPETQPAFFYP